MVKIKQKKTMNLPQLIEHIWANNLRHKWKDSDNTSAYVQVYDDGQLVVDKCTKDSVFTVEVEEEITEDTVLDEMLLVYDNGVTHIAENKNLSFISKGNLKSAYYMNDDLRLILIWRDGELIKE